MERRLWDIILLPAALLVVLLEDVVWAGASALLRGMARLAPVRWLDAWLRTLPGWAALPLFLLLEVLGRLGELWAVALLVQGHAASAAITYIWVRLLATLAAVFVYHACEAALMRYAWFVTVLGWVRFVRDWALARIAPWRAWIRRVIGQSRSRVAIRFAAMRRVFAVRRFGAAPPPER